MYRGVRHRRASAWAPAARSAPGGGWSEADVVGGRTPVAAGERGCHPVAAHRVGAGGHRSARPAPRACARCAGAQARRRGEAQRRRFDAGRRRTAHRRGRARVAGRGQVGHLVATRSRDRSAAATGGRSRRCRGFRPVVGRDRHRTADPGRRLDSDVVHPRHRSVPGRRRSMDGWGRRYDTGLAADARPAPPDDPVGCAHPATRGRPAHPAPRTAQVVVRATSDRAALPSFGNPGSWATA